MKADTTISPTIAGCSQARTGTDRRADGPGGTAGVDAAGVEDTVGAGGDAKGVSSAVGGSAVAGRRSMK
jgi:hypothetical protein